MHFANRFSQMVYKKVGAAPIVVLSDNFDRADDATTVGIADTGQVWTSAIGTFGISGGRLYSVTDASGDIVLTDPGLTNFTLRCITNCQTVTGSTQRILNILFHVLDNTNFLMVRISNGTIDLWKNVAGTLSRIAFTGLSNVDNVDESFSIVCSGNNVLVYARGTLFLNYTLVAGETVFAGYTKAGFRLGKVGTPTGTARADNLVVQGL